MTPEGVFTSESHGFWSVRFAKPVFFARGVLLLRPVSDGDTSAVCGRFFPVVDRPEKPPDKSQAGLTQQGFRRNARTTGGAILSQRARGPACDTIQALPMWHQRRWQRFVRPWGRRHRPRNGAWRRGSKQFRCPKARRFLLFHGLHPQAPPAVHLKSQAPPAVHLKTLRRPGIACAAFCGPNMANAPSTAG